MSQHLVLLVAGAALLLGFVAAELGRRAHVPRVTLLLLLGVACGSEGLDVVPHTAAEYFPLVTGVTLGLIGFLLGRHFEIGRLRVIGRSVLSVSLAGALLPALLVFLVALAVGAGAVTAALLAALAAATDPAATLDVVEEVGARGRTTETLLGVVAVDDAWAILLFGAMLTCAQLLSGDGAMGGTLLHGLWEIGGGVLLGLVAGVPMAFLTGRVRDGELTLVETLGFVLLTAGAAAAMEVSYLLACMTLGAVVENIASHHERAFHAIESISPPFLVVFFLLAGVGFHPSDLGGLGLLLLAYLGARTAGKVLGGHLGVKVAGGTGTSGHVGWCLLPQGGLALGFALVAVERFPDQRAVLLPLMVAATAVFEIAGPVATRVALNRAGERGAEG